MVRDFAMGLRARKVFGLLSARATFIRAKNTRTVAGQRKCKMAKNLSATDKQRQLNETVERQEKVRT